MCIEKSEFAAVVVGKTKMYTPKNWQREAAVTQTFKHKNSDEVPWMYLSENIK